MNISNTIASIVDTPCAPTLPDELMLEIIYACKVGNKTDRVTLSKLYTLCKQYHRVMESHRKVIIEHYTVITVHASTSTEQKSTYYRFCGEYHRDSDQPAITEIDYDGEYMSEPSTDLTLCSDDECLLSTDDADEYTYVYHWYQFGKLHREGDKPAALRTMGQEREWYCHGKLHRDGDLPAAIYNYGNIYHWYQHGQLHRDGDKPAVITRDIGWDEQNTISLYPPYTTVDRGYIYQWYQHGQLHRDNDKPAVVHYTGRMQEWYRHGLRHRDGGLPAVIDRGIHAWFVNGEQVRQEQ